MTGSVPHAAPYAAVTAAAPGSPEARAVLTAYFRDIVSRYHGRAATPGEVRAAMAAEPSADLCPPHGLRLLPARTGEITRVFVVPEARRRGVGKQLLDAVEDAARQHAVSTLRLDTRSDLAEARQLYATNGYQEVAPFNDGRFADQWYGKILG